MGLDLIEFNVAIEDAFGIYIPDAEARELTTPAKVVAYVLGRVPQGAHSPCLEQRAFYRLRAAGMQVLQRARTDFTPSTRWADLLHPSHHQRQWELLGQVVALKPWPRVKPIFARKATIETVGHTARTLAMTAPTALFAPGEGWNRPAVEAVVRRFMAEDMGILQFDWDHRFVEDLGCG